MRAYAWFCGALAFISWIQLDVNHKVGLFVPLLIWGAYYGWQWPGKKGLRWQSTWKTPAVAFAWAWLGVVLPWFPHIPVAIAPFFAARFLFVAALALAYDLHDRPYDQSRGLYTLAARLGAGRCLRLMYCLLGAAAISELLYVGQNHPEWAATAAVILSYSLDFILIKGLFRLNENFDSRKMAIDGLIVLHAVWAYLSVVF